MILAAMTAADEDALMCDFAEVYHVYNYRGLPLRYAATLACGLRSNSRIRMSMAGQIVDAEMLLLASAADALNRLVWFQTKDAKSGRNRPASFVEILMQNEKDKPLGFDSPEAFERERRRLLWQLN